MKTKKCRRCNKIKSLDKFYKDKKSKSGLCTYCKLCMKKYVQSGSGLISKKKGSKKYRNSKKGRESYYQRIFNITLKQYDEMFERQKGVCEMCGRINKYGHRLCVDHNHETGEIRTLLCHHCNTLVGWIENNPGLCKKVMDYIYGQKSA